MANTKANNDHNDALYKGIFVIFGAIILMMVLPSVVFGFVLWLLLFRLFNVVNGNGSLIYFGYLAVGVLLTIWDFVFGGYSFKIFIDNDWQVLKNVYYYLDDRFYGYDLGVTTLLGLYWKFYLGGSMVVSWVLNIIFYKSEHVKERERILKGQSKANKMISMDKARALNVKSFNDFIKKNYHAVFIGTNLYTKEYEYLTEDVLNTGLMVTGTTGSGKTITLTNIYCYAIRHGYPLIIVDGKPDEGNIDFLVDYAAYYGREFYGFNCDENRHFDALNNGSYTMLMDKIISLKSDWDSDHYKTLAQVYLQLVFEVLLYLGEVITLEKVIKYLRYDEFMSLGRSVDNERLRNKLVNLDEPSESDLTGLKGHLSLLSNSEFGEWLQQGDDSFTTNDVINQGGVAYFALPALRYPSFSKVLGTYVVNDIKSVIDTVRPGKKIFIVFDEFSIFATEQVLNIFNQGRSKGVRGVLGTQTLADLDKVSRTFKDQCLANVNTIITQLSNDDTTCQNLALWAGKSKQFEVSVHYDRNERDKATDRSTIKEVDGFNVNPDDIKSLRVGEAFMCSKDNGIRVSRVAVNKVG